MRPDNGNISIETNGTISTAVYSCDVGYSVADAGLHSVTCQSNGSWESHTPSCSKYEHYNFLRLFLQSTMYFIRDTFILICTQYNRGPKYL